MACRARVASLTRVVPRDSPEGTAERRPRESASAVFDPMPAEENPAAPTVRWRQRPPVTDAAASAEARAASEMETTAPAVS